MPTPEHSRVSARANPAFNPAIAALRSYLSSGKDAEDAFRQWLALPMTRLVVAAIEELADSPPPFQGEGSDTNGVLLQYGMTAGLNLARKLASQPNRVFPEIFAGDRRSADPQDELDRSYEDTSDSVIDSM